MSTEARPVPQGRFEIVVSGSGGQGIILAGKLLAETAAVYSDRQAAMTPCYGPEVRGGVSTAELIIDSAPIDYPRITRPNVLIALSQAAMDRYGPLLGDDDLMLVNDTLVGDIPRSLWYVFSAPFTAVAVRKMKTPVVANMIALGALAALTGLFSDDALKQIITRYVPERVLEVDLMAVDEGFRMAGESGFSWLSP